LKEKKKSPERQKAVFFIGAYLKDPGPKIKKMQC
jgi:hypothetical protein